MFDEKIRKRWSEKKLIGVNGKIAQSIIQTPAGQVI